jgi:hypothetical protein
VAKNIGCDISAGSRFDASQLRKQGAHAKRDVVA